MRRAGPVHATIESHGTTHSRPDPLVRRSDEDRARLPLWPTVDIADTPKALAAAAAPWTKAVADITKWQMDTMAQFAAPWTGGHSRRRPDHASRSRTAGSPVRPGPRTRVTRHWPRRTSTQTDLLRKALDAAPLDERSKAQWSFALRQVTDALSPANTLVTNPEALRVAIETNGASLVEGLRLFTEDLAKGRIAMTDEKAFEVGVNVCTTPGKVVFQNELIQLIQYTPTTEKVFERPLLIVPPCINKYYILDLQPANSFVANAVAAGTDGLPGVLAQCRPGPGEADLGRLHRAGRAAGHRGRAADQRVGQGQHARLLCRRHAAGQRAGGAGRAGRAPGSQSMTLLTTMLDFTDTGEIGLLVSEQGVAQREAAIGKGGLLKGSELAQVFASLRANDLIWPYVVKGYLKGQAPPPFDLLYWNSDDTNLPGPMFCWYLRNTYLENKLREPGGTVQCGVPVDLGKLDIPTFVYASKEDHIVPWKTAYASTQIAARRHDLRARRQRPHRRRDQPAGQDEAQLLAADRRCSARRGRRRLVRRRREASPAAGGRPGPSGWPALRGADRRPGTSSATPSSRRSRTRPAPTSRRRRSDRPVVILDLIHPPRFRQGPVG